MADPLKEHLKDTFLECFGVPPPESFDSDKLLDMTNYHYLLETEPVEFPPEE